MPMEIHSLQLARHAGVLAGGTRKGGSVDAPMASSSSCRRPLRIADLRRSPAEASRSTKPVVLIGGTAGAGKTTLARELCALLGIAQRLGTGFIREIIRSETTPQRDPELYTFTFRSQQQPLYTIKSQAARIQTAVIQCINRAVSEGTSLVIEGTHILPELYLDLDVSLLVLAAPPIELHEARLKNNTTHSSRPLFAEDFSHIRAIDKHIVSEAKKHRVPIYTYNDNLRQIARDLVQRFE